MTKKEIEIVWQFLASNWYDREEEDEIILEDIVQNSSPEYQTLLLKNLKKYSKSKISTEEKMTFITKSVWRYFTNGDEALNWFQHIVKRLEKKIN